jgi:hypothetical protein
MGSGNLRLGEARGMPANSIEPAAEELEPLAPALLQPHGCEWSTPHNTVACLELKQSKITPPRRGRAAAWVVATATAAFCIVLLGWTAQQDDPLAFEEAHRSPQSITDAESSRPMMRPSEMPIRLPIKALAGLAAIPIEPSRVPGSISRMPALVHARGNAAGEETLKFTGQPATAKNAAATTISFVPRDRSAAEPSALANAFPYLLAEAEGGQKLDPAALIARGDEFLRQSDATSARLFYKLAAANGSAAGAIAMGSTYDPIYLERDAVRGVKPEPGRALSWYRTAADLGDATAKARSAQLIEMLRRDAARGDPQAKAILEGPLP